MPDNHASWTANMSFVDLKQIGKPSSNPLWNEDSPSGIAPEQKYIYIPFVPFPSHNLTPMVVWKALYNQIEFFLKFDL